MNTPRPPMEPLDEQEREFARILRALPGGEPPPALDAAILRAATNAAAASKRPAARFLASAGAMWGIGSAAAAVLALGVAWQLRYGAERAPMAESAPRAQMVSEHAEDDAVQVELGTQPADAPFVAPPPPPAEPPRSAKPAPAAPVLRRQREAQPARDAAPAAAAPEPEAFAADQLDEHVAREDAAAANAAEGARRAAAEIEYKGRSEQAASNLAAKSATSPPPPPAASPPAPVALEAQSRADAGSAAPTQATGSALGALADTDYAKESRKPATWLADIRKLRDQGRLDEARAALIEFRKKYPKWVIPTDLAPLLSE